MNKYIKLADILKTTIHKKQPLKYLLYNDRDKQAWNKNTANFQGQDKTKVDPRVAYSNLSLITNNLHKFQKMYSQLCKSMRMSNESVITNKYLLFVMVAEYFNVGKITGGGRIKKIIMSNLALLPEIQLQSKINKHTISIRLRSGIQPDSSQEHSKWESLLRQHGDQSSVIPNLYNLSHGQYSKLVTSYPEIRKSSSCIVQSFSSNLPACLIFQGLNNQSNAVRKFNIIDACAAPGNKTLQLSQYLRSRGTVYAFQKDKRRFEILCKNIQKYNADNIFPQNADFLLTQPSSYKKIRLILLDPSCSGSGMLTNFTRDENQQNKNNKQLGISQPFEQFVDRTYACLSEEQKQKLQQLKQFQIQLLCHAVKFNPQRISYSTCSIFKQQNQQVVQQFLALHPQYCIKPVLKVKKEELTQIGVRAGFGKQCKNCVRVDPRKKASDGFFVCIFGKSK